MFTFLNGCGAKRRAKRTRPGFEALWGLERVSPGTSRHRPASILNRNPESGFEWDKNSIQWQGRTSSLNTGTTYNTTTFCINLKNARVTCVCVICDKDQFSKVEFHITCRSNSHEWVKLVENFNHRWLYTTSMRRTIFYSIFEFSLLNIIYTGTLFWLMLAAGRFIKQTKHQTYA